MHLIIINQHEKILPLIVLLFFLSVGITDAHPGRTDANGGHYCRTNCEKWGYGYGEYHYHGGGEGLTEGIYTAPVQEAVALPINTPIPTRIPTEIPTRVPTKTPSKTPTPTIKLTITPTKRPTPTIAPAQEVKGIQANAVPQRQGFFSWLLSLFGYE